MYTSLLLVALSGPVTPAATPEKPAWLQDYGLARTEGRKEGKPLAVFIGSGESGWEQLSREGAFGNEIAGLLADNYVCVYVDANSKAGRKLASAFEITEDTGIVLSDRGGDLQAFRHEGTLANQDLKRYLRKYAEPDRVTVVTDSNPGEAGAPAAPAVVSGTISTTQAYSAPVWSSAELSAPSLSAPVYHSSSVSGSVYSPPSWSAPAYSSAPSWSTPSYSAPSYSAPSYSAPTRGFASSGGGGRGC